MTKNDDLRDDSIFLGSMTRVIYGNVDRILSLLDKRNALLL